MPSSTSSTFPTSHIAHRASALSAGLCNASILLYTLWLLLPAVQTTGGAAAGVFTVAVFALGVLLDTAYLKASWLDFILRALCAAALPLIGWFFMRRGGGNFLGFYVQQGMFWFPLLYCAYARQRQDPRLWRYLRPVLFGAVALTTLTTIGWLIEGILRPGDKIYAYSRSLGYAGEGREAYLKELMLKNIGGYDFIYASVLTLPITCYGIMGSHGWKRAGLVVFCGLQVLMIALSQYTYALIFAGAILAVEIVGALIRFIARKGFKRQLEVLPSMLCTLPLALLLYLLRIPLVSLAASIFESLHMSNFAFSLQQLLNVLTGNATDSASRLGFYQQPLEGIMASPLIGGLPGQSAPMSQHSDLMDLLSALGILGSGAVAAMIFFLGRGSLKGLLKGAAGPHLMLQFVFLLLIAVLGTVVYSRDIPLVIMAGALLLWAGTEACPPTNTSHTHP